MASDSGTNVGSPAAEGAVRGIRIYQRWVSPLLGPACRFHPTCSEYAALAIRRHGVVKGSAMGAGRLLRCHPFCEGGIDPVR